VEGEFSRAQILENLQEARGLITLLNVRVDEELLSAAPELKVVANFAVGYDNVDVDAATRRGVVVTNTPDVLTDATADLSFALLLAAARHLTQGDRLVRSGDWKGWAPELLLGQPVFGRCLGVIGAGRIGRAMLQRGRGFGMSLVYTGTKANPDADALGARFCSLEELLALSDFVSIHCPLVASTANLINADSLSLMKSSAVLVNTARGGCVDTAALIHALETGSIAGAGLDVFAGEPDVPEALRTCPNVILAPHIGSATFQARRQMAEICAGAVSAVLAGRIAPTMINPGALR